MTEIQGNRKKKSLGKECFEIGPDISGNGKSTHFTGKKSRKNGIFGAKNDQKMNFLTFGVDLRELDVDLRESVLLRKSTQKIS